MADNELEVMKLLNAAVGELQAIVDNPAASEADRDAAQGRFEELLLLMGREASDRIEGRTALLAGLIEELNGFTKKIKVKNPIAERLKSLGGLVEKASGLLKKEKKAAKEG